MSLTEQITDYKLLIFYSPLGENAAYAPVCSKFANESCSFLFYIFTRGPSLRNTEIIITLPTIQNLQRKKVIDRVFFVTDFFFTNANANG